VFSIGEHGKLDEAENVMMEIETIKNRKEDLLKMAES
jgi:hypothetical protein